MSALVIPNPPHSHVPSRPCGPNHDENACTFVNYKLVVVPRHSARTDGSSEFWIDGGIGPARRSRITLNLLPRTLITVLDLFLSPLIPPAFIRFILYIASGKKQKEKMSNQKKVQE